MRDAIGIAALVAALSATPALAAGVKIDELVVARTIPAAQRDAELKAASTFYQFWNTGDATLLKKALSPHFRLRLAARASAGTDRTGLYFGAFPLRGAGSDGQSYEDDRGG